MCSKKFEKDSPEEISDETIAAIITPPGEGGIAAVRLAGKASLSLLNKHFKSSSKGNDVAAPFVMRYGTFVDNDNNVIDEVMAVYMPAGRSYTGREQVELFCHGGYKVVRIILDTLLASGARSAEPGEFTKLAFLCGRIDLAHAEAVAEIISANSEASFVTARDHLLGNYSESINLLRTGLISILAEIEARIDFPEEEIDPAKKNLLYESMSAIIKRVRALIKSYRGGRIIKEGFKIAIAGRPNAGKSSLFNLLLKKERALVTPTAGTTRDYLSEWIELDGYAVNLVDTAGLREKGGAIEKAGQKSAYKIIEEADLLLWIYDLADAEAVKSLEIDTKNLPTNVILLVGNKIDLPDVDNFSSETYDSVMISCHNGSGIDDLTARISALIKENLPDLTSGITVTSARHKQKLELAHTSLEAACASFAQDNSPELVAFDLRQAINQIDEISGRIYNEEILGEIFARFCIGK